MNDVNTVRQLEKFDKNEKMLAARERSIRNRKIQNKRNREKVVRRKMIGASIFALGLATTLGSLGKSAYDNYKTGENNKKTIFDEISDDTVSLSDVVNSARHATTDHLNVWIDYGEIGSYINDQEDIDRTVYTLLSSYGESDDPAYNGITDKTLSFVEDENGNRYGGLNDFLSKKGMNNIDEFKKSMKDKILAEHQMEEIQAELNNSSRKDNTNSLGGK